MIARAGSGWQTVLADLALILFMLTAATLSNAEERNAGEQSPAVPVMSLRGEPLAFYKVTPDGPPLKEWLAAQSPDERLQLTIVAQFRDGGQAEALRIAGALAAQSGGAANTARIIVEPGNAGIAATLAFDIPDYPLAQSEALARSLQDAERSPRSEED
ncbi:MAG: hypothetical protein KUG65_12375 [Sphingomonadaceae bacterium]|nr:hypothetical protein [Sphingomonadaceae bacterium]